MIIFHSPIISNDSILTYNGREIVSACWRSDYNTFLSNELKSGPFDILILRLINVGQEDWEQKMYPLIRNTMACDLLPGGRWFYFDQLTKIFDKFNMSPRVLTRLKNSPYPQFTDEFKERMYIKEEQLVHLEDNKPRVNVAPMNQDSWKVSENLGIFKEILPILQKQTSFSQSYLFKLMQIHGSHSYSWGTFKGQINPGKGGLDTFLSSHGFVRSDYVDNDGRHCVKWHCDS